MEWVVVMCQACSHMGYLSMLYSQSCPMEEASRGGEVLEGRSTASPEGLQSKEINDHTHQKRPLQYRLNTKC